VTITHSQRKALAVLQRRHEEFPDHANFATMFLGERTTALLRKLVPLGLVAATRGGSGRRQFFSITDAGRSELEVQA
jgi:DNA-binding MarR family transcriptional regulator